MHRDQCVLRSARKYRVISVCPLMLIARSHTSENSSCASTFQSVCAQGLVPIFQANRQSHGVALDPTFINRHLAVRWLAYSNRPTMFSSVIAAPGEMTFGIQSQRTVYGSPRTVVINRSRTPVYLDAYMLAAPCARHRALHSSRSPCSRKCNQQN
jgi:hypothetical protein